ncbi:MAG: hypothetical protein P0S95_00035 [Rhabdochlamydiaceae bacterium]|nr:hypothetical protein [Candidatus Amphrikana amoebophyrae]
MKKGLITFLLLLCMSQLKADFYSDLSHYQSKAKKAFIQDDMEGIKEANAKCYQVYLLHAVNHSKLSLIRELIDNKGIDPYSQLPNRSSPYFRMLMHESPTPLLTLYQCKNKIVYKKSILPDVIQFSSPLLVKAFLNNCKEDLNKYMWASEPLIFYAFTESRSISNFKMLLQYGYMNLDKRNSNGNTVLHEAVQVLPESRIKHLKIAMLLEKGADPFATNDLGETPFDVAVGMKTLSLLEGNEKLEIYWDE